MTLVHVGLDDSALCVTDNELQSRFGSALKLEQSTIRHFAPGQTAPKGLRPTQDDLVMTGANGARIAFEFDYICASGISLSMNRLPATFFPRDDEQANEIEIVHVGMRRSQILNALTKVHCQTDSTDMSCPYRQGTFNVQLRKFDDQDNLEFVMFLGNQHKVGNN